MKQSIWKLPDWVTRFIGSDCLSDFSASSGSVERGISITKEAPIRGVVNTFD